MARKARKISPIHAYTVMLRVNDDILLDEYDQNMFLSLLCKYKTLGYKVLAYDLLPETICFVLGEAKDNLELAMRKITVSFVTKYNAYHKHKGSILKDRFTSIPAETYDQLWDMVFDMNNMNGKNSGANYAHDSVIDIDMAIARFGNINDFFVMQDARIKNSQDRIISAMTSKMQDSDLVDYFYEKYGMYPTELKYMGKNVVNSILADILKYTKASVRQIGRVTKISLKFLWNFSKRTRSTSAQTPKEKEVE